MLIKADFNSFQNQRSRCMWQDAAEETVLQKSLLFCFYFSDNQNRSPADSVSIPLGQGPPPPFRLFPLRFFTKVLKILNFKEI
jgi:hypothetical protein